MSDCCTPSGYRWIFSRKSAESQARRYRRKGLDATSARLFDVLRRRDLQGLTVLEVGGGIGDLQLQLLKAGAPRPARSAAHPTHERTPLTRPRAPGLESSPARGW